MKTTIAQTILNHLGGDVFSYCVGAKELVDGVDRLTVWIGKNPKHIACVSIQLNSQDLYNMEFLRERKGTCKIITLYKKVKSTKLPALFEKGTGLRTNLKVA